MAWICSFSFEEGTPWKLSNEEKWEQNYQELLVFREENGNCKVPRAHGIGEWVSSQRKGMKLHVQGKKSCLNLERIEKLTSIEFEWNLNNWDEKFEELCAFELQNGHCLVRRDYGTLGRWVSNQRARYWKKQHGQKSTITDDEIEKLEGIGFEW